MTFLDTNAVIDLLNNESSPVFRFVEGAAAIGERIGISTIVLFELFYGASYSARRKDNADRILDFTSGPMQFVTFDADDAKEAGDIRALLRREGTSIGPYDVLIAAQARRRNAVLVSANTRELSRVPRLRLEDWTKPSHGED